MDMQIIVKPGQSRPQEGSEVVFKDDARFLFGGFISRVSPKEYGEGGFFLYEVEVSDYAYILNSKVARRAYSNMTLKAIVEDLLGTYVDASYGFTTTFVETGPLITSIVFDHISIRKCFEKLNKLTGYVWWVDYEKNVYFQADISTGSANAAPETITDSTNNFSEIGISYETSQVRNTVIVIGSSDGEESLSTNTQTFTGDDETRSWELDDRPSTVVSIKINGVSQQFSLDLNERDTDVFVYNFEGKSFRLTNGQTTPVGADLLLEDGFALLQETGDKIDLDTLVENDIIEIVYYPRIPIVAHKKDDTSIAFFAALDGGDGIMEYTLKDPSITSKAEALERAQQELDDFADPLVTGIFKTRTGLLTTTFGDLLLESGDALLQENGDNIDLESINEFFEPGQILTVNLPTYGINTDTTFLIQEVTIEMTETASTVQYIYTVRFGGRLAGVREFLESLASQSTGEEVSDATEIVTIEDVSDLLVMEEGTAASRTILSVFPFDWEASGATVSKWNLAEWS